MANPLTEQYLRGRRDERAKMSTEERTLAALEDMADELFKIRSDVTELAATVKAVAGKASFPSGGR